MSLRKPRHGVAAKHRYLQTGMTTACLLLLVALPVGCRRKPNVSESRSTPAARTSPQQTDFAQAISFLNSLDQYQLSQARDQVLFHLRQWVRKQDESVDWIADPLFTRLPEELREGISVGFLSSLEFDDFDGLELQEAVWMRDIANHVSGAASPDPRTENWIAQQVDSGQIPADQGRDLTAVYRLFDWTVRNVQLDPELEPRDFVGGAAAIEKRGDETLRRIHYPHENLLYSHGDWLERSRVFILLARQLRIPVVMLIVDRQDDSPTSPWLPAALIGDELYLFDPLYGLPIPASNPDGIARLSDVIDQNSLLAKLEIGKTRYRLQAQDLENLRAAVDATPASLSQRMKLIESKLTGENQMVLTVEPSSLARKLRTCRGINGVEIWELPYRIYRFLMTMPQTAAAREMQMGWLREARLFTDRNPLVRGRLLQFRGAWQPEEDQPGAMGLLLECRTPKQELEQFDEVLQSAMDGPRGSLDEDRKAALANPQVRRQYLDFLTRTKQLATYWLGQIAMEKNEYRVAMTYFDRLGLQADKESEFINPWAQSVQYNLARAYESQYLGENATGSRTAAVQLYEQDTESPQRAGNLVRARRLQNAPATDNQSLETGDIAP